MFTNSAYLCVIVMILCIIPKSGWVVEKALNMRLNKTLLVLLLLLIVIITIIIVTVINIINIVIILPRT